MSAHHRGNHPQPHAAEDHGRPRIALPARSDAPDRAAVLAATAETMARSGRRWAWQGPADAPIRWVDAVGPKDLDLWYDGDCEDPHGPVPTLCRDLHGARVAVGRHPGRPRHVSVAIETPDGAAIVDVTGGDLRVGAVLLVPAGQIELDRAAPRFTGAAAVADLLVRPLLRGRLPDPARLAEARAAWTGADDDARRRLLRRLRAQLGAGVVERIVAVLDGHRPDPALPRRARLRLAVRGLAPSNIAATWAQRRTVVPAGRAAGPFDLRIRGVVVAVVGTDGAGKSTVAHGLHQRLRRYGLATDSAYFGMAHGNLPGVALARRLLGVTGATRRDGDPAAPDRDQPGADQPGADQPGADQPGADQPGGGGPAGPRPPTDRPALRRAAAWFYAGEYVWRYVRLVAPGKSARRVVIVDRWVTDLRDAPWPGSLAARVAQLLVPDPDLLVLPDAPIEAIHARKPERPLAEQAAQQERCRRLLAERLARYAEVVVDTSGAADDPLRDLVARVVEAAHAVPRGRRPG